MQATLWSGYWASHQPDVDKEVTVISLITGSVAEFYIEPMLPHIGDIDLMLHLNMLLAIPRGHPPPTQLPAEFHNYVKVFEIIDSHLPGYVYLKLRYLLTQCSYDGNYNAVEYDSGQYLSNQSYRSQAEIHGPAEVHRPEIGFLPLSSDIVRCIHCLSWPPQAADWPTRHRNDGWPDTTTLDRVVSNGCDVVGVAHHQCKQQEWMGNYQWRLSFSRAEIVLINSWMPVQQIVYHMLRFYVKTERMTKSADNSGADTLSNYHIKTLMLWACELKTRSWWTEDVNLVRMCVQLLHILDKWLANGWCQHYFINNCNLIDYSFNMTNVRDQMTLVDQTWLSTWFVDNYIQKCLQLSNCPQTILRLFDDVTTSIKLQNAVSALFAWRHNRSLLDLWTTFHFAELSFPVFTYIYSWNARSFASWVTQWTKIDSPLSVYITAVAFLHVACRLLKHGLNDNDKLMDILVIMCGLQFTDIRRNCHHASSVLSLNIAAKLMKVVANKSVSTMSLIEIELFTAYLHRALRCKDSDSDSIYCLANVYLAVLYYAKRQFQTAINHYTLVTRSQDHSQCSSHVVQGEILPKIDNDVDNMLGLAQLYQCVQNVALNEQLQSLSIFTTELFAYYLHIKHLAITNDCQYRQTLLQNEFKRY